MTMQDRLAIPQGIVDAVLDTDAFNEIDDQFAIAYLLRATDRVRLRAIFAAPFYDGERRFYNFKSNSAKEGMEDSYAEILRLLKLMNRMDFAENVYKGAEEFLSASAAPQAGAVMPDPSPASLRLIELAMEHTRENPLYVVGIAAPTNITTALLLRPEIAERIVVVWLGGAAFHWPECCEFNLSQDLAASQRLFAADVPLVQIPGMGVSSAFTVTPQELTFHLKGRNPLCDYLADNVLAAMNDPRGEGVWSRPIWDVTAAAFLTGDFTLSRLEPKPMPGEKNYDFTRAAVPERYVYHIHRDALWRDLLRRLWETQ